MSACQVPDCDRPVYSKQRPLCRPHNTLLAVHGTTDARWTSIARFFKNAVMVKSGCWEWRGAKGGRWGQYGSMSLSTLGYHRIQAHRAAWLLLVGPIPEGLTIDHLCRNTKCVNPHHLEPVTQAENNRRYAETVTQCVNGHEFTEQNTYVWRGHRTCRTCHRLNERKRRAALR